MLARHIARRLTGRDVEMSRGVALRLLLHRWPDNVRELESVVERLAVEAGDGDMLTEPQWLASLLETESGMRGPSEPAYGPGDRRSWDTPVGSSRSAVAPSAVRPAASRPVRPTGPELESQLRELAGNVRSLAEQLGVSRNTLYKWFKRYGIEPDSFR